MSCCNENSGCSLEKGPGYQSPADAIRAPKEKIIYTVLVHAGSGEKKPDRLATVDVDPESSTYSKIIHELDMKYVGDELHHFGWNACSSCCNDSTKSRRYLVLVGLKSSRIYIVDTIVPTTPTIHKIIEPEQIKEKANLSAPHTVHCLANGKIMISMLGDAQGNAPGGFLLLNSNFEVEGRWADDESKKLGYNYDFWYQPYHNIMVSSEWAAPNTFLNGFNPAEVNEKYGRKIYFWNWSEGKIIKEHDLGAEGLIPLELRFHHNPKSTHGFIGCALSSSIWHWFKNDQNEWIVEKVIQTEPVNLESWPFPVPSLITDIILSMDDKFIYFANWFHGDIRQYDITDPSNPKLVGQIWLGGLIGKEASHNGKKLVGGPQMLQLSLDGKRLYVTNSLFSSWDDQFFPDIARNGSHMLLVNVNTEVGGLSLDDKFYIDFGGIKDGPFRAHEMRYPGGDCTSDIWIS